MLLAAIRGGGNSRMAEILEDHNRLHASSEKKLAAPVASGEEDE
jgi:hypothetical protein